MKVIIWLSIALILLLASCKEKEVNMYSTYADAVTDGAVDRGWVPAFVPSDARDISETHNVDVSQIVITFIVPNSDFVRSFRPLSDNYVESVRDVFRSINFPSGSPTAKDIYHYQCIDEGVGLLAKTPGSQRVYYFEPLGDQKWLALCMQGP